VAFERWHKNWDKDYVRVLWDINKQLAKVHDKIDNQRNKIIDYDTRNKIIKRNLSARGDAQRLEKKDIVSTL